MNRDHTPETTRRLLVDIVGNALLRYWTGREREPSPGSVDGERGDEPAGEQAHAA